MSKSGASMTSPSLLSGTPTLAPPEPISSIDPVYARVEIVRGWKGQNYWAKINDKTLDAYEPKAIFNLFAYHGYELPNECRENQDFDEFNARIVAFLKKNPMRKPPPSPKPGEIVMRGRFLVNLGNITLLSGLEDPLVDDNIWIEPVAVMPPFPMTDRTKNKVD